VGCVKEKANRPLPARELYTSALFRGRRSFVERSCGEWWILSAAHGLVDPDATLAPYDVTLKTMDRPARRRWSAQVLSAIDEQIRPVPGDRFEIHAGAEYREFGLADGLLRRGCVIEVPALGMSIGRQLQFYKAARESS
jgi:hypothetical protein